MRRDPLHYAKFLSTELGTQTFPNTQGRYIIQGCFKAEQIKNVTSNYVRTYLICPTCKSTHLQKQGRLHFLICERYKTKVSVAPIECGFVANTPRKK